MLIACAANEAFLAPASAMLHSLTAAAGSTPVDVVVLHDEPLSTEGRARLEESTGTACERLRFVPVEGALLEGLPTGHYSRTIWARTLLPEVLADAERVLYLDADTIVIESLVALWETQLGGAPLAAVANPLHPFMRDQPRLDLGIDDRRRYINSGVLLMDLELMREEGTVARMREYARAHSANPYPDQDAFNALFSDRHVSLHPRWNAQTPIWDLAVARLPFSPDEVRDARTRPAIVHFTGPFKPWHFLCRHPFRDRYFEHLAATPWPAPAVEGRTPVNRLRRLLPADWMYRSLRARDALAAAASRRR